MFLTKVVQKVKTHKHLFFENRAIYEIIWENTVQLDRPRLTIWRMRMTCWITKVTNTHSKYI